MNWISSLGGCASRADTAVALGFFDGVHLGHRAVLAAASACRARGLVPAVATFSAKNAAPPAKRGGRIYTDEQRAGLFASCGIELVLMPDFAELGALTDREFTELLCGRVRARELYCGEDYRFGCGARGDVARLRELCGPFGARVHVVPFVDAGGGRISSTRIRELLGAGDVAAAGLLLGRRYFIDTCVETGQQLGRRLGFPTINQPILEGFIAPRYGVYATFARVDGRRYRAVTNVGVRPTVGDRLAPRAETYLMNFSGDLYGKRVTVEFAAYLRGEQKFAGIEELKRQIAADAAEALHTLARLEAQED